MIASSGSSDNEVNFLNPGIMAAELEAEVGAVRIPESAGDGTSETSLSFSLSLDFGEVTDLIARLSISWNTPSRRKVGLYSVGTFVKSKSTN